MKYIIYFTIYVLLQSKFTCKCLKNKKINAGQLFRGRIVGGSDANIRNWPFIAALMLYDMHRCGGSLISKECVVTAAHCVTKKDTSPDKWKIRDADTFTVQLGSTHLFSGYTTRTVKKIFVPATYSTKNYDNDVALLILSEAVSFSDTLKPIEIHRYTPSPGKYLFN